MTDASPHPTVAQFLAQHRELKELLCRIDCMLTEQSASVDAAAALLGQLGDRLVKHFALEEADGYFAEALTHSPQLIARANDLLAQHPKMTHLVRELTAAEPGADWWQQTRERFQAFTRELLKHERSEDQLLQEAYARDIAATD
jgi:hemerythrin